MENVIKFTYLNIQHKSQHWIHVYGYVTDVNPKFALLLALFQRVDAHLSYLAICKLALLPFAIRQVNYIWLIRAVLEPPAFENRCVQAQFVPVKP